ncbi:hypothetical protein WISP_117558 [Willisornis vidua]|uniref:Uncharacterized protein n=1 Tax=Willisornis vidua TaxID=1566151 RepID=A0ABQ9CY45_9PASS|nr:hypothetical protein WISP_117558 [Willisornis vidua]
MRCEEVNDLLCLMAELKEEVERLRSIRESEKEIDWWSHILSTPKKAQQEVVKPCPSYHQADRADQMDGEEWNQVPGRREHLVLSTQDEEALGNGWKWNSILNVLKTLKLAAQINLRLKVRLSGQKQNKIKPLSKLDGETRSNHFSIASNRLDLARGPVLRSFRSPGDQCKPFGVTESVIHVELLVFEILNILGMINRSLSLVLLLSQITMVSSKTHFSYTQNIILYPVDVKAFGNFEYMKVVFSPDIS